MVKKNDIVERLKVMAQKQPVINEDGTTDYQTSYNNLKAEIINLMLDIKR